MIDYESVNQLLICTINLLFSYNVIIAVTISNECSRLKIFKTKDIIMIEVVVIEKFKLEVV